VRAPLQNLRNREIDRVGMPDAVGLPFVAVRSPALASAIVLFAIMLGHALLETARDALFLANLGPERLASAYVVIAGVALAAVFVMRRWSGARHPRRMLIGFLAIATLGTGILAATLSSEPSLAYALYVWTGLVATLVVPTFWLVVDRGLRIGEAKKTFGLLAAGGGLGALVGSALATGLARFVDARHLVTTSAVVFALAAIAAAVLAPRAERPVRVDPSASLSMAMPSATPPRHAVRYVRLLLALGVISTVTLTLGDLMFKRFLAEQLPADALAFWFGAVYTGLNVIGLVVQLAVTARLLDRVGVGTALTLLPALVLASVFGFVLTGAIVAVIALKLADGGLRHSVHRVTSEILFLPLTQSLRDTAKPIIDVVGQRGGQALAAVATMAIATDATALGLATGVCVVVWLGVIAATRVAYVQQFRATLEARDIARDVRVPALDVRSVQMLMSALASPDEAEAAAALDLLLLREENVPALVLYHPSPTIVRRALASLDGKLRPDVSRVLERLTAHADPQIRAAALAAASRTNCYRERLIAALGDAEPDVRAAAVVGLHGTPDAAPTVMAALLRGSTAERVALAHAIGRSPREAFRDVLDELAARREAAVVREVVHVWEREPALGDGARLLLLLDHPHVRGDVRRAILAGDHLELMLAALDDPRTPLGVRRHLPRTISLYRSQIAAAALVARLPREPDGTTEFKILRALGRMRADDRSLRIDPEPVRAYVRRSVEDAGRDRRMAAALSDDTSPTGSLLGELLVEKRRHAIERTFRALGILYPAHDLRSVHDAITSDDDEHRTAAREILDEVLPVDVRAPLVDELELRDSARVITYGSHEEAIGALLVAPSDSLRCIAAHLVAQRQLVALRPELVRLKPTAESLTVTRAFDQAIASLDA
jgi:ATP:ADP antiporter, AAA family